MTKGLHSHGAIPPPSLRDVDARVHGLLLDSHEVFLQFGHPDVEPVVETVEEEIRRAVIINKQRVAMHFSSAIIGSFLLWVNGPAGESAVATQICSSAE